jgi:protein-tyrosine phosphatase
LGHGGRIIDQITPYPLWVGHAGDGSQSRMLHELGIEAIVQVAAEEPPLSPPRSLIYHRYPLLDGSGNPSTVLKLAVETVASLIRLRIPTLVCCGMGLSRSPAIAAAGLALAFREPADEVLRRLADRHPVDVSPALWAEVRSVLRPSTNEALL